MSPQPSVKQEDVLQASSIYKNRYSTHRPLNKKVKLGSTKDATQFIRLSGSARKRFKRLLAAGVKPDVARIVALESPNRKDSDKSTKKLMTINCGDSKSDGVTPLTTQSTEAGVSPQLLSGKQEDVHLPSGNSSSTDFHPRLNDSSHLAKLAKTAKRRFNMLLDIGVKPDTARIAVLAFVDPASAKHPESSSQKSVIVPSKNYHRRAIDRKSISSHRGNLGQRTQDRRTLNRRTPDRRTSNRRPSNRETRDRRSRPLNNKNNDTRQGSFYSPVKNSTNKPPREKKKHHPAEAERTAAKKQLSTHIPSKEKNEDHPEDAVQIVEDVNSKRLHPKSGSSPAPGKRQPSDSTPEDVNN
ncbi:hypothetical protein J6590_107238 [Homalodisca vitripennis]|nr:hypothetical protein J6590_107238 [Homalodisca vitripennis]